MHTHVSNRSGRSFGTQPAHPSTRLRPRGVLLPLALLGLLLLSLSTGCSQRSQAAPATPPPMTVEVTPVIQKDVSVYGDWVATLDGYVNEQIQPHVSGYLIRQDYREGAAVSKGQVLFEIDPRPFQATLDQARAQLAEAQAQLGKATLDVHRDTPLAKARAIAQSQLDNDIQARLGAQASVASAQAAVEQARLNLGFTRVTSLVSGIAGIARGQVGDLVTSGTLLTSVSQVNPIKAYFSLSEQQYLEAQRSHPAPAGHEPELFKGVPLQLTLADGTVYPHAGHFYLADRQVDSSTGTIRVAAVFSNPGDVLRPGQFGRIRAVTSTLHNALLVPQRAVNDVQGSNQVAVVGGDGIVHVHPVQLGPVIGNQTVISSGLQPGDTVIVEGGEKVRDGMPVRTAPFQSAKGGH